MTENNKEPEKTLFDKMVDGEEVVRYGLMPLQAPLPSHLKELGTYTLKGKIAGAYSGYKSEEPDGFKKVTDGDAPDSLSLTADEIKERQDASVDRYESDPIYGGIINAFINFIIGAGFQMRAQDESQSVTDYLTEFNNINNMKKRSRDMILKYFKAGECFVRFFKKARDGRIAKYPVIRILNYWEITKINRDPKDVETIISYERSYKDQNNDTQIEVIPAEEIIHVKEGEEDMFRGLPPFQSVMKHCVWYDDWVHNRVVYNRLKTSFYLEEIVQGTPGNVTSAEGQHPTQTQKYGKGGKEIHSMPKMGSKITHNAAVKYNWLKPDIRADDASEDGRVIRMAICTGVQVPEFVLGDASNANFASIMVAQNPFVRKIEHFQVLFEGYFKLLYSKVIQHGVDTNSLSKKSTKTETVETAIQGNLWGRVKYFTKRHITLGEDESLNEQGDVVKKKVVPTNIEVDVVWPTIIKQNLKEETEAYQIHQNMGVASTATLSQKLGYDWDEEQRKLDKEEPVDDPDDPGDDDFNKKKKRDLKKKDDDEED